jgi:hypothetical protein
MPFLDGPYKNFADDALTLITAYNTQKEGEGK